MAPSTRVKPFVGALCAMLLSPQASVAPTKSSLARAVVPVVPVTVELPKLPAVLVAVLSSTLEAGARPLYSQTSAMAPLPELGVPDMVTVISVPAPEPTVPNQISVSTLLLLSFN